MKIACLIPTRKDRPMFLENCLRMLNNQTIKPDIIEIVDDLPTSNACDITWRYRTGYDRLRNKGIDVIFLIEDDDYYASNYLEICLNEWVKSEKPDLFGQTYTIYYHIKHFKWLTMHHHQRSSAMNTLIKPDLNFKWGLDSDAYTDAWLWYHLTSKKLFTPKEHICIGIKHGVGLLGGANHVDHLERYEHNDFDKEFLRSVMDSESFKFYAEYFSQ